MQNTPPTLLERIQFAKENHLTELDLQPTSESGSAEQKLTRIPDEVFELEHLKGLNLSGNLLESIPDSISRLRSLVWLDLDSNGLVSIPKSILSLSKLKTLNLKDNPLKEIPEWIFELKELSSLTLGWYQPKSLSNIALMENLESLSLIGMDLSEVPEWLPDLTLTALNLSFNRLTTVPNSISELKGLARLNLMNNRLRELPGCVAKLSNLVSLDVSLNQLATTPDWLSRLSKLNSLDLSFNEITALTESIKELELENLDVGSNNLGGVPEVIRCLKTLTQLGLGDSDLEAIPEWISELSNLRSLYLADNHLTELPESLSALQRLETLTLSDNEFTGIPSVIYSIPSLTGIYLGNNGIKVISSEILRLKELVTLALGENPIESPPVEVVQKGVEAVRDYFRQLEVEGEDYLYEAKLLIVGEPGAGKTSLAKKIENPEYQLKENEKSTEGIAVIKWDFELEKGRRFRINMWDFGGQEIYHATHQFFLTKRSLYLLVADIRQEDTDFYYWLNVVELLSDNSPVLIIKNEKQDRKRQINESRMRGEFGNLKETLATNLETNRGLAKILAEIKHYVVALPHIGQPLPRTWVKVREALEQNARNFISLKEYLDTCQRSGFTELSDKLQLSSYLHDIGVCLHFQDDPILKKIVILKPRWGTDAVYKVLDDKAVGGRFGRFTKKSLASIWDEGEYAEMQDELLQLMINFKLAYKVPGGDFYIVPQLLSVNQPKYDWDEKENLIIRYTYEFMPKGILTQFIVAMHAFIDEQKFVWKSGIILKKDRTKAEVMEDYGKGEIKIRVAGKLKKELMTIVTYELDKIHGSYTRLRYSKLIPCNCPNCKNSQNPHFYSAEKLWQFLEDKQYAIQCQKRGYEMVDVRGLIDDVTDKTQMLANKPGMSTGEEKVFAGVVFKHVDKVMIQQSEGGTNIMTEEREGKDNVRVRSAWANGSFYLFTFAVVIAGLGVLARTVPPYVLPIVLIAGILLVPIIGALQLRQDDRLSEKGFGELMKLTIGQLPLIGKLAKQEKSPE